MSTHSVSLDVAHLTLPPSPHKPSADEAEAYLDVFRSRMLPSFAFIRIPPSLTAQQLR
jgi:hypothetical protein